MTSPKNGMPQPTGILKGMNRTNTPNQKLNTMKIFGHDKQMEPTIGSNPNINVEDDYIHNLQQ
jgi:hypothetical protein